MENVDFNDGKLVLGDAGFQLISKGIPVGAVSVIKEIEVVSVRQPSDFGLRVSTEIELDGKTTYYYMYVSADCARALQLGLNTYFK